MKPKINMKNRYKKGAVNILTAILIIVIVVVGVALVYNIVNPLISKQSGNIETGFGKLLLSHLEIGNFTENPDGTTANVIIKAGTGEDIERVRITLETPSGNCYVEEDINIKALETRTYTISTQGCSGITKVTVEAIPAVEKEAGVESEPLPIAIAHYNFENNPNDITGNNNDGTIIGTSQYNTGKIGNAVIFDGSTYIKLNDNSLPSNTSVTISFWTKAVNYDSAQVIVNYAAFNHENVGRVNVAIGTREKGTGRFVITTGKPATLNYNYYNDYLDSSSNNKWNHHVVILSARGKYVQKVYLNGVERANKYGPDNYIRGYIGGGDDTIIGRQGNSDANYYQGVLDELKIWDSALTAEEVLMEYNRVDEDSYQIIYEEDSPFGIFGVFDKNYPLFMANMGFNYAEYCEWAGNNMQDLNAKYSRQKTQLIWDLKEPILGAGYEWAESEDCSLIPQCLTDETLLCAYQNTGPNFNMVMVINPTRNYGGGDNVNIAGNEIAFQDFVSAAVERYDGDGIGDYDSNIKVKYWQAYNEPFPKKWFNFGGTVETYIDV